MTEVPGWYLEFAGAVTAALPPDIDQEAAQAWVDDPAGTARGACRRAGRFCRSRRPCPPAKRQDEENWTLVRDDPEMPVVAGANIRGGTFPEGSEDLIGEPMVELILGIDGLLGQRQAEYLMEHPNGIPEELERYALVFPGTVWQSPDQNHQVPCLVNRGGTWEIIFGILEGGFDSRDLLAETAEVRPSPVSATTSPGGTAHDTHRR